MKVFKRLVFVFLVVMAAGALAGCGSRQTVKGESASPTPAVMTQATPSPGATGQEAGRGMAIGPSKKAKGVAPACGSSRS